jgi:hypothetical protein
MLTGPAGTVDDLPVKFRVMRVAQVRHDDLLDQLPALDGLPADGLLLGDGAHIRCEQPVVGVRLGNGGVFRRLACGARAGRDSGNVHGHTLRRQRQRVHAFATGLPARASSANCAVR